MTTRAKKILAALKRADRPLYWYEAGMMAYPRSTRERVNIFGNRFIELAGHGLTAAHAAITELERDGLVTKGADHRYKVKP